MEVYKEELGDVTRYLNNHASETLEDKEPDFRRILKYVGKFKAIHPGLRMIEIGTGMGSFPILCKLSGLRCEGLEISRQLIEHAHNWGKRVGAEPDIRLGNLEEEDLGEAVYDVIVASSVFEHVELWRPSLEKLFRALKPGGALFFESTNKWSVKSGEFPPMPFYGWLPNWARYRLRKILHGPDIMKLGIDFHQFTYSGLRRVFRQIGFSQCHDVIDLIDADGNSIKKRLLRAARKSQAIRIPCLLIVEATTFVCIK
jgi:SAM-dependent methyltransferase